MTAWGPRPFENDEAMDFVGDVSDAPATETERLVRSALSEAVDNNGYLEATAAFRAVAAAALLAAATGAYDVDAEAVGDLVVARRMSVSDELRDLAEQALQRVLGVDSEWREHWERTEELDDVAAEIAGIREALAA